MIQTKSIIVIFLAIFLTAPVAYAQDTTYTVQVAACEMRDSADSIAADLKAKGYTPYIHEATDEAGKKWFLVRLEDFSLDGLRQGRRSGI